MQYVYLHALDYCHTPAEAGCSLRPEGKHSRTLDSEHHAMQAVKLTQINRETTKSSTLRVLTNRLLANTLA